MAGDNGFVRALSGVKGLSPKTESKVFPMMGEENLSFALEACGIGTWNLDLIDHTAHRSLLHDQIFGYDSLLPEWTYEMFLQHVLPEYRAAVDEKFRQAVDTKSEWSFECRIRRADGEIRWIWAAGRHQFDEAGTARKMAGVVQDITKRRESEAALRESEERFRAVFESTSDCILVWDADYNYLYANQAAIDHVGTTRDKVIGMNIRDGLGHLPDFMTLWMERVDRAFATGEPFRVEDAVTVGNRVVHSESQVSPIRDSAGHVFAVGVVYRDVTEQKRGEKALERSRNRLELLSETVSSLLTAADPQDVVERICNKVQEFLDCAVFFSFLLDPRAGRLRLNACGGVDPQTARKVEGLELEESLCGTAATGRCRVVEENLGTSNDPRSQLVRSIGVRAYACHPLLGPENEVLGTLSFGAKNRDTFSVEDLELMKAVTDHVAVAMQRRRSDEALRTSGRLYRAIGESIDYGIWICDPQGRNTYASDSFLKLVGMTQEQCSEFGWGNVLHPDDVKSTLAAWKQCVNTGGPWYWEHRYLGTDGQYHPILACGVPVRNEQGEVTHWAGINLDISRLKQAQEELRAARDELNQSNLNLEKLVSERTAELRDLVGELEHFSYSITHDMRAPLRAMMGFAEVLKELSAESGREQQMQFLERIASAARRMDLLITDALNYSKAVRNELPLAPVKVGRLLRSMVDTYPELQYAQGSISVESGMPPVIGNEAGLTQCFSNLLGNAVKFAQPGRKLEVRVHAEDRGGWVRIWVEDNGIGIPERMLPKVFDMFAKGAGDKVGTGIGLALVRKVAQRMGGRVGVESEEGKGSRFWVELKMAGGR